MSSVNSLTSIATIFFSTDTDTHVRVFYQDGNGDIRESFYDHSVGWNTRSNNLVGTAAQKGTGISAVTWNNGGEIRVYYLDQDNNIVERVLSGETTSWGNGALTQKKIQTAPGSRLSAIEWNKETNIRVYYQDTTNKVRELVFISGGGWKDGSEDLPLAVPGTGLAAALAPNPGTNRNPLRWVYFQAPDLTIQQLWYDGTSWSQTPLSTLAPFPAGTNLAVVTWEDPAKIQVAAIDVTHSVTTTSYDPTTGWAPTLSTGGVGLPSGGLALVNVAGGPEPADSLRLYYQPAEAAIQELLTYDGGASWSISAGQIVPK
ncbi:fucose-specific lectin [Pluteus cervinus]|uniref:Fucose-specific lectin n=1 Tax=Pluteus cervinus TaxID=181527 RepID=A0ACD3AGK6_9AGAR|nr:fucose-specific lectin [Pluteus cervinus]